MIPVPPIIIPAQVSTVTLPSAPCRAEIDTGASLTLAGGDLGRDLLRHHVQQHNSLPVPVPFSAADGRPFVGFPVKATVQIPVDEPIRFIAGYLMPLDLAGVDLLIHVGVSISAAGTATLIRWDDCDLLIGRDLISRFKMTIVNGITTFTKFNP